MPFLVYREIPLTLIEISSSRIAITVGLYDNTLPADFIMGSLHNVDYLVNTILNKLLREKKQVKVLKELKIEGNSYLDQEAREKLKA